MKISLKGDRVNRTIQTAALVCAASALAAAAAFSLPLEEKSAQPAASATKNEEKKSKMKKTPSGLQYEDTVAAPARRRRPARPA